MVSTGRASTARACSSNCDNLWERTVTSPLSDGRGRTSEKYTSSPCTSRSTANTPRPPSELTIRAAIDFAASSAAGERCCGCHDSRVSPSPRWWPIGSQNDTDGPAAPTVRTVSSVTAKSTSTTDSAITRFMLSAPPATARRHAGSTSSGRSRTDSPSPGTAATGLTTSGKPACCATAASSCADPANQNGAVGRPSSSAASRRRPSPSRDSRAVRGVGNTSRSSRSARPTRASVATAEVSATTKSGRDSSIRAVSSAVSE